jgi:hypothetical protein
MRLSRKLQKLFSRDLPAGLAEHVTRSRYPFNARRPLVGLDRTWFEQLRERYPYRPGSPRINRFEDEISSLLTGSHPTLPPPGFFFFLGVGVGVGRLGV